MTDAPSDPTTRSDADAASEPAVGSIIAERYRLIARLGAGGMGAVYRGEHITLRNPVAVKFLHRFASVDSEMVARFEREAQTAALIDHPHVARAIDFGKLADGTFYLVMEYVEGPTLAAVLRETPKLPPARALAIASAIGSALGRAHALGIVHRDIKPDNVVLTSRDGVPDFVKVIDFGIARTSQSNVALTQVGTVFGTPGYLSPEQALGQPVDAAADQYALGIVTFQMLTGRTPFVAADAIALLQQHIMAPIPRASDFAPELPRAVDEVLTRMLGKRPAERFPSVDAAMNALRSAIESAPIAAASTADTLARMSPPIPSGAWAAASGSAPFTPPPLTLSTGANVVGTSAQAGPKPRSSRVPIAILTFALLGGAVILVLQLQRTPSAPSAVASSANSHGPASTVPTHAVPSNTASPPTADSSTASAEPQAFGPSSRNCRDGHCVCRDAIACSYACGEEPCDATCERMRTCHGQCRDHCRQQCRDGQQCDLHCRDDCSVACRDLHDCRVSCGERCDVDCSMMMNCQVRMRSGSVVCGERTGRCDVQCLMPDGQWQFAARCGHGRYQCPPGSC